MAPRWSRDSRVDLLFGLMAGLTRHCLAMAQSFAINLCQKPMACKYSAVFCLLSLGFCTREAIVFLGDELVVFVVRVCAFVWPALVKKHCDQLFMLLLVSSRLRPRDLAHKS